MSDSECQGAGQQWTEDWICNNLFLASSINRLNYSHGVGLLDLGYNIIQGDAAAISLIVRRIC